MGGEPSFSLDSAGSRLCFDCQLSMGLNIRLISVMNFNHLDSSPNWTETKKKKNKVGKNPVHLSVSLPLKHEH